MIITFLNNYNHTLLYTDMGGFGAADIFFLILMNNYNHN